MAYRAQSLANAPRSHGKGPDYFSAFSDHVFDVGKNISFGRAMPTLHQAATACHIPGKIGVGGGDVFALWQDGKYNEIIEYNVFDALTTYLLWLRCAHFSGVLRDEEFRTEQQALATLVKKEIQGGNAFLEKYLNQWQPE